MSTASPQPDFKTPEFVQLKDADVNIRHLEPALLGFLTTAGQVHSWLFQKVLVVTSGNDGVHVKGSAHYANRAADLRSMDKTLEEQMLFAMILTYLGEHRGVGLYDERQKPGEAHYHVELMR